MLVSYYIGDSIFVATSKEELLNNVNCAMQFFDSLGLTIYVKKSVLVPTYILELLVVTIDPDSMIVI